MVVPPAVAHPDGLDPVIEPLRLKLLITPLRLSGELYVQFVFPCLIVHEPLPLGPPFENSQSKYTVTSTGRVWSILTDASM